MLALPQRWERRRCHAAEELERMLGVAAKCEVTVRVESRRAVWLGAIERAVPHEIDPLAFSRAVRIDVARDVGLAGNKLLIDAGSRVIVRTQALHGEEVRADVLG